MVVSDAIRIISHLFLKKTSKRHGQDTKYTDIRCDCTYAIEEIENNADKPFDPAITGIFAGSVANQNPPGADILRNEPHI